MSICPCCGEANGGLKFDHIGREASLASRATEGPWAEEVLIECCRLATRIAGERRSAVVETGDFLSAMASLAAGREMLSGLGLSPEAAAARARAMVGQSAAQPALPGMAPVFSGEMLAILERGEARAQALGHDRVSIADIADGLAQALDARAMPDGADRAASNAKQNRRQQRSHRRGARQGRGGRHGGDGLVNAATPLDDPFQIRTTSLAGGHEAASESRFVAETGVAAWDRASPRAQHRDDSGRSAASRANRCDTRRLEQLVTELGAQSRETNRSGQRQHDALEARLEALGHEVQALQAALEAGQRAQAERLSQQASQGRSPADHDRLEQRLGAIETVLQRLEEAQRRQAAGSYHGASGGTGRGHGRGHGGGAGRGDGGGHREASGESEGEGYGEGDRADERADARGASSGSSRRNGRSGARYSLSSLSRRRRRRRSSRSSRSSQSAQSAQSSRWSQASSGYSGNPFHREERSTEWTREREAGPARLNVVALEDDSADGDPSEGDPKEKRFYLAMGDEIVCAPSIGPRTAARLNPHGIDTVADLLAADAADLAERLGSRHITTQTIEDWQMQARLVCTIPWLRGTHAQLLVGAGYTSAGDIAAAGGEDLSADILKFASTREGQRILRNGPPPPIERVAKWAEFATLAELDRAA